MAITNRENQSIKSADRSQHSIMIRTSLSQVSKRRSDRESIAR
jgi:hypothetical protein